MYKYKFYLALSFLLLSISSCEKNTDSSNEKSIENTDSNKLSIDGEDLELDKALLMNWGEWDGFDESYTGYRLILGIYSPEVQFDTLNGEIEAMSGIGHGIEFELFAEKPQDISNREFVLSSEYTENTFTFAVVYSYLDFAESELQDGTYISNGTLNLEVNNNQITVKAQLSLLNGEIANINYSGNYLFLEPTE